MWLAEKSAPVSTTEASFSLPHECMRFDMEQAAAATFNFALLPQAGTALVVECSEMTGGIV